MLMTPGEDSSRGTSRIALDWDKLDARQLLPYRSLGDPLADETIDDVFRSGELDAVRQLMRHLKEQDDLDLAAARERYPALTGDVIHHLERYLEESELSIQALDPAPILAGQQVFAQYGPEILMILATYSLPASYTARRGVRVLAETGRLESDPLRRLIETTQMVVNVMSPGGMTIAPAGGRHGSGVRTAQKVRLMHAAIRRLILTHFGDDWVREFGVPINQMDLAGTLMTFSSVVLDGLQKLGVPLSQEEKTAYLAAWQAIGRLIGVRAELVPQTISDADRLTAVIRESELGKSQQGVELTRALVETLEEQVHPRIFGGVVVALMHDFLGPYARVIEVPPANWTRYLLLPLLALARMINRLSESSRLLGWLERKISLSVVRMFLRAERGGERPQFDIPDRLADGWGIGRGPK